MRLPLLAAALAFAAAPLPALAGEEYNDPALAEAAAEMADPDRQLQVAGLASAMLGMVMEMPVGAMMRAGAEMAGEDAGDIDPDLRVADIAGPDAADMPGEVAERIPELMDSMSHMVAALDGMLPQLREMAETMENKLPNR